MDAPDIVIDTNIIISAQRSQRGASAKLMSLISTGRFEIHLGKRAKRGSREKLLAVLAKAPDMEPGEYDRL